MSTTTSLSAQTRKLILTTTTAFLCDLESLRDERGLTSVGEVITHALAIYKRIYSEKRDNPEMKVELVYKNGSRSALILPVNPIL